MVIADEDSMLNPSQLVCVRVYGDSHQAHLGQSLLQEHGIDSVVTGDEIGTTLSWYGSAVVKIDLMVQQANVDAALKLLDDLEQDLRRPGNTLADGPERADFDWICPDCDEKNPTSFAACWNCETQQPADPTLVKAEQRRRNTIEETANSVDVDKTDSERSPYDAPAVQGFKVRLTADHDLVTRATRAAVFSLFFPPLSLYCLYLTYRCFAEGRPPTRVYFALAGAVAAGCIGTLMYLLGIWIY